MIQDSRQDAARPSAAALLAAHPDNLLLAMYEQHSAIMVLIDPDTRQILDANDSAAQFYGYSREELRTLHVTDVTRLSAQTLDSVYTTAKEQGGTRFMAEHRLADGSVRTVEVDTAVIRAGDHRLMFSIIFDVTDRETARAEHAAAEARTRALLEYAYNETAEVRATLQMGLEASPDAFAVYDVVRDPQTHDIVRLQLVIMNTAGSAPFGFEPDELVGKDLRDFYPAATQTQLWDRIVDAVHTGVPVFHRDEPTRDGRWVGAWDNRIAPVGEDRVVIIWRDVTELVLDQQRLADAEALARAAVDASLDGMAVFDKDEAGTGYVLTQVNTAAQVSLPGFEAGVGQPFAAFLPDSLAQSVNSIMDRVSNSGSALAERLEVVGPAEWAGIYEVTATPVSRDRFMLLWRDVTVEARAEADLTADLDDARYRATHDALTGLANRVALVERLRHVVADPGATLPTQPANDDDDTDATGMTAAVVFMDLDNFKEVNDTLGHDAGDLLLVEVAHRLRTLVRIGDLVARIGGDEFILVLTGLPRRWDPEDFFARTAAALGQPVQLRSDAAWTPRASMGLAFRTPDLDVETWLARADQAMYEAKRAGRGRGRVFTEPHW